MVKKLTITTALEPFLSRPKEELHLADISRQLCEPHPTVRQHLNVLEKEGILRKRTKGRLTLYSLNNENDLLIDYLMIAEKQRLIMSCKDLHLKEIINHIRSEIPRSESIIFGSAAVNFLKANDIDLLVIGMDNIKLPARFNKSLHVINVKSLDKVTETLKQGIVKKHLIINGSDILVRWLLL
ncbi:MAG: helix-turn-helix domain-containing protein [Nanoarchaeota archaeon]|nr:helix-turn-helix domain-containing protein [Nanoarchaeota archaeon]